MVSLEEHPGSWELTGRFPGMISLIRGMSGLCQEAGGVPGTGALMPGTPYLAQPRLERYKVCHPLLQLHWKTIFSILLHPQSMLLTLFLNCHGLDTFYSRDFFLLIASSVLLTVPTSWKCLSHILHRYPLKIYTYIDNLQALLKWVPGLRQLHSLLTRSSSRSRLP